MCRPEALAIVLCVLGSVGAAAGEQEGTPIATATGDSAESASAALPERPFLYAVDPSLPSLGHVLVTAGLGNATANGELRPTGAGQLVPTLRAEVGLASRLSIYADGAAAFAGPERTSSLSLQAGAHVALTDPANPHFHLGLEAGYGRDFAEASSVFLSAAGSYQWGRVRTIASLTASRTLRSGADGIDLNATVGSTVALPAGFRVGAEVLGTDLEEISDPGAEGGAALWAGPTVGWEWRGFQAVAGPALGSGPGFQGLSVIARAAASFRY